MKAITSGALTWEYTRNPEFSTGTWTATLPTPITHYGQKATKVVTWYDPNIRQWTTYLVDDDGTDIGIASEYAMHRDDAFQDGEYIAKEYVR